MVRGRQSPQRGEVTQVSSRFLLQRGGLRQMLGRAARSRNPQALRLLTILATWGPLLVSSLPHFPGWSFLPGVPHTEYLPSSCVGPKTPLAGVPASHSRPSAHVPWSGVPRARAPRASLLFKAAGESAWPGARPVLPPPGEEQNLPGRKEQRPQTARKRGGLGKQGAEHKRGGGRSVGPLVAQ